MRTRCFCLVASVGSFRQAFVWKARAARLMSAAEIWVARVIRHATTFAASSPDLFPADRHKAVSRTRLWRCLHSGEDAVRW
jgi:hypothetical protein